MSNHDLDIPVVDLEALDSPQTERRREALDAILRGFGHYGLMYIRNHDVDIDLVDAFYDAFLEFTERPEPDKQELSRGDLWYQRGWTPPNTEEAVVAGQPDFKECYFASPGEAGDKLRAEFPEIYAENIWPDEAEAFRDRYLEVGRQLQRVGVALLRGCARALELEAPALERLVADGPHVTRALRYVPLDDDQVGSDILWGEEHTDFNCLTILPGGRFLDTDNNRTDKPDEDAGLYLRTRPTEEHPEGRKIQGQTPDDCIIAQVGQQLEVLTGGKFLATPHVVEAPDATGYSRVSMAHFVHMNARETVFPLESFCTDEAAARYGPPVKAGTYNRKTLVDIGLAPDESLDRLGYTQYSRLDSMREAEDNAAE